MLKTIIEFLCIVFQHTSSPLMGLMRCQLKLGGFITDCLDACGPGILSQVLNKIDLAEENLLSGCHRVLQGSSLLIYLGSERCDLA